MAKFKYEDLSEQYGSFIQSRSLFYFGGKDFSDNKDELGINNIVIENTCEYKAAIASFHIFNAYDLEKRVFKFEAIKKYIFLGNTVVIYLGHGNCVREVFRGFISAVNFRYEADEPPGITVSCMDIKGIMMSGSYVRQLTAGNYSDAVSEILRRTNYEKLKGDSFSSGQDNSSMITSVSIADTPDKTEAVPSTGGDNKITDKTIEMVAESDYEFVVKAAKKFNFEFFTNSGSVIFRKAKSNRDILMELAPDTGMKSINLGYDITGLVSKVEVRGINAGDNKLISASRKLNDKISNGNAAKGIISGIERNVVDPTIYTQADAGYRADYIAEDIAYRLGSLRADFIGLPELTPGFFVKINILGENYPVEFYLTDVIHKISTERGYTTTIIGKASSVKKAEMGMNYGAI